MTSLDHSLPWAPSSLRACILPHSATTTSTTPSAPTCFRSTSPVKPSSSPPPLPRHHWELPVPRAPIQLLKAHFSMATPGYKFAPVFSAGCVWLFFCVLSLSGSSLLLYFRFYEIRGPIRYLHQNQSVHSTGSHVILWLLWLPGVLLSPDVPLNHLMVLVKCRFQSRAWNAAFLPGSRILLRPSKLA